MRAHLCELVNHSETEHILAPIPLAPPRPQGETAHKRADGTPVIPRRKRIAESGELTADHWSQIGRAYAAPISNAP